jgi:hypothetical protein
MTDEKIKPEEEPYDPERDSHISDRMPPKDPRLTVARHDSEDTQPIHIHKGSDVA